MSLDIASGKDQQKCQREILSLEDYLAQRRWDDSTDILVKAVKFRGGVDALFRCIHFCAPVSFESKAAVLSQRCGDLVFDLKKVVSDNDWLVLNRYYFSKAAFSWLGNSDLDYESLRLSSDCFSSRISAQEPVSTVADNLRRNEGETGAELVFHTEFLCRVLLGDSAWVQRVFESGFSYLLDSPGRGPDAKIILLSYRFSILMDETKTTPGMIRPVQIILDDLRSSWFKSIDERAAWGPSVIHLFFCVYLLEKIAFGRTPSVYQANEIIDNQLV